MNSSIRTRSQINELDNLLANVPDSPRDAAPVTALYPLQPEQAPRPLLSLVAPCHNEQEVLPSFIERISWLSKELDADYRTEVLLIDDGSTDATWTLIREAVCLDVRFRGIKLSRNFGQQAALTCGYELAAGDAVVSLDADLQDPPELVPEMLARWREGTDVVFTVRASRTGESLAKRFTARLFYCVISRLCGNEMRPESGDFRLLSRRSLDALLSLSEQHRFVRGMVGWIGFRSAEVVYDRPIRAAGRTHYSYRDMANLALDAFVSSGRRFLSIACGLTSMLTCIGIFGWLGLLAAWGFGFPVEGIVCGTVGLLIVLGTASVFLQVIAATYLGRIFEQVQQRPLYIIEELFAQQPMTASASVRHIDEVAVQPSSRSLDAGTPCR